MDVEQLIVDFGIREIAVVGFFCVLIFGVFILGVRGLHSPKLSGFGRHGAALCTTLGVLGTFVGIFLGLWEFDVARIDASVPHLLAGLKIAFLTSVFGMAAAVVLRCWESRILSGRETATEATPEEIHRTLRQIDSTISQFADRQIAALAEVCNAISADSDSSLVTQTQRLRISVEDGNRNLTAEFRKFAETMAENNSRALIEALERIVRDFNTQLNEQFGENFKQLNQAVGALLEWQERYRSHVETMEQRIESAVDALQTSEATLRDIATHAGRIPETLTALQALLDGFSTALEALRTSLNDHEAATSALGTHLEAIAGLRDRALEAFPTIETNIRLLTENLTNTIETHTRTINNSADAMQTQHQAQLKNTEEMIGRQFGAFDQQMQQELTRVLETMGQHLASLSEKFVTDYGPLTDRLRALLDAVERGLPERRS